MGAAASTMGVCVSIDGALPYEGEWASLHHGWGRTPQVFPGGHKDRQQFVQALFTLLSNNGKLDLRHKRFQLLYTRPDNSGPGGSDSVENETMKATMVALSASGIIVAKIESTRTGKGQIEAFQQFRKHVEIEMHRLLDSVPPFPAEQNADFPLLSQPQQQPQQQQQQQQQHHQIHLGRLSRAGSVTTLGSNAASDNPPTYLEANKR